VGFLFLLPPEGVALALSAFLGCGGVAGSALPADLDLEPAFLGYRAFQGVGNRHGASLLGFVTFFAVGTAYIPFGFGGFQVLPQDIYWWSQCNRFTAYRKTKE
jgi:hypothetical protein